MCRDGLDELQAAYIQQRTELPEGAVLSIPEVAMSSSLPNGSLPRTGTASMQAVESAVERTISTSSSAYFAEVILILSFLEVFMFFFRVQQRAKFRTESQDLKYIRSMNLINSRSI